MLSRTALREEFLARCTQGSDRSMVQNGSFTRYGWAVFLMGRWGNSSEPWVTLYRGDNTLRLRCTFRKVQLARPVAHWDGGLVRHKHVPTPNLVLELVEGRVHGYGAGARVIASTRLPASLTPVQMLNRIERFLKRLEEQGL